MSDLIPDGPPPAPPSTPAIADGTTTEQAASTIADGSGPAAASDMATSDVLPADVAASDVVPAQAAPPGAPARPGLSTFTIEGRAAPGLFVVGWLASILGAGILVIGFQATRSPAASVLVLAGLTVLSIGLVAAAGAQAIERRARGVTSYAGPSPFLVLVAAVAISSVFGAVAGLVIRLVGGDPDSPATTLILLAIIQLTYLGLTRLLVVGTDSLSWADMGFVRGRARIAGDLVWGAAFALPVIGFTLVVAAVVAQFISAVPESPLPPTGTTGGLLLNLIGGAVLVPLGEELLFRGVATTAWLRVYGPARAIIQGGLFFAVVHVLQVGGTDPAQALALALVAFVSRVPVAIALGWLFVSRRSIWASVGLHAAFNGTLLVLAEVVRSSGAVG